MLLSRIVVPLVTLRVPLCLLCVSLCNHYAEETRRNAMKIADLVIKKIRNNELPPTVTIEELRALGVL